MSDINYLVSESLTSDDKLEEAGILRGIAQGAVGTLGSPIGGALAAGSRAQRNKYEDKLAELNGEKPKGMTVGRGIGAAAAGMMGSIPLVGGLVNAYQGFRAGLAKRRYEKAAIANSEQMQNQQSQYRQPNQPQYASVLTTPLNTSILSENNGLTPSELENNSISNWSGNFRIYEDNKVTHLMFQLNENEWIHLKANQDPNRLRIGETTFLECRKSEDVAFSTRINTFNGHGFLSESSAEFEFTTPLLNGKYHIYENSGFPGAKYKLTRIE